MSEYLTVQEVLELLKISRNQLYKLTKDGKIPGYKLGGSIRYKRNEVEQSLIPKETKQNETRA